jgi:hypothetical protein
MFKKIGVMDKRRRQSSKRSKRSVKTNQTSTGSTKSDANETRSRGAGHRARWIINPKTLRLIEVGKATYNRLLAAGIISKSEPQFVVNKIAARWADVKPNSRTERRAIYEAHPDMFMLPPNEDLRGSEKSFNKDNFPKYPISTSSNPGVPQCQGIKSALNRLAMNNTKYKDPAAHAFILGRIQDALFTYCSADR